MGETESRTSVLEAIRRPLGLLVLVVLVIEGLLAGLAVKAEGRDFTILVVGAVSILAVVVLAVFLIGWRRPDWILGSVDQGGQEEEPKDYRYDVFISAPMAGFEDETSYKRSRNEVLHLIKTIKERCGVKTVYYAGESLRTMRDFEVADLSLSEDLEALRQSRRFVFIYPKEMITSSFVEVGAALALRKPSIVHVREGVKLPYLLENAGGAAIDGTPIHIYRYKDSGDIERVYAASPEVLVGESTSN